MNWQAEITEIWGALLLGFASLAGLVWIVRAIRARRRPTASDTAPRFVADLEPRCPCGDPATHPTPYLTWDRTGFSAWIRTLHGAPPKYTRKVDTMRQSTLCALHARVADSLLDEWIFGVRGKYALLNRTTAIEAASFEQEGIGRAISDSLTDTQKDAQRRASKRPPALTALAVRRSGSDGDT